ncbi:magnesium chelatase domain-containing protein [Streptomyces sp. NPDC053560]|uniref:magnesium chelatase domain-containing protein n=1 Tax=Streptomyces sp. NPDC053560 TaxID=3365711 RepID=UPI0037CFADDF
MSTQEREFIIVGQGQGTSYTLWGVAPAPADPEKRAVALEEIAVDAMDALGEVTTVFAATGREAVDKHVANMRELSGLADYGLSPDSRWEAYGPAGDVAPDSSTYGNAEAAAVAGTTTYTVTASSAPGVAAFAVEELPTRYVTETRDRVRAGVLNSGLTWPESNVLVRLAADGEHTTRGTSSLDLAIACTVLAASGRIESVSLEGVTLIGELGLDGRVRDPSGVRDLVQAAAAAGHRAAIVPDAALDEARTVPGIRLLGVASLNEVRSLIGDHFHHPAGCVHCTGDAAHRACAVDEPCADCRATSATVA